MAANVKMEKEHIHSQVELKNHTSQTLERKKKYSCDICDKISTSSSNLRNHIKAIHEGVNFECKSCPKIFATAGILRNHTKIVHEGIELFKCDICDKSCSNKQNLQTHITKHIKNIYRGSKNYNCDSCNKTYSQLGDLKRHKYQKHNEGEKCQKESKIENKYYKYPGGRIRSLHKCDICEFQAKEFRALTDHIWRKHLKCNNCNLIFQTKHELKLHMKEIHQSKDFCDFCEYCSSNKNHLESHYLHNHNICKFCTSTFDNREDFQHHIISVHKNKLIPDLAKKLLRHNKHTKRHIERNHEGKDYLCDKCKKIFKWKTKLMSHNHHRHNICKFCKVSFDNKQTFQQHVNSVHKEKMIQCDICDFTAMHNYVMINHNWDKHFRCHLCHIQFQLKLELKDHMIGVHQSSHFCDQCDFSSRFNLQMESHMSKKHNILKIFSKDKQSKLYKCNICGTSFLSKQSIKDHYNSAHRKNQKEVRELLLLAKNNGAASYKCEICEKIFHSKTKLKQHQIWHGEWNHECDICHKMFPGEELVKRHKDKTHVSKLIPCRWNCGQIFNSHGGRIRHERTNHYLNKPLERICDICGKPCPTEFALKSHKKTHLNPSERIEEYRCSICSEKFPNRRQRTDHRKIVHNIARIECPKCNKKFEEERHLKLHMKKHESSRVKKDPNIHSCHQCSSDKKYTITELRRHLKIHHSAIYKCEYYECQKVFMGRNQERRYNLHRRKHQHSKCHLCNYVSNSLNHGPMNVRIHLLGVHKLTVEDLISMGRYDPKDYRVKTKDGESWLTRY